MIRTSKAIATAAILFVMPTMASALGVSIVNVSSTGASTTALYANDEITFDLRLDNPTNVAVNGLELVVSGFDTPGFTNAISSGLQLVGGSVTTSALNSLYVPGTGPGTGFFGGLTNLRTAPTQRWQLNLLNPEAVRTSLFLAASLTPSNGNGSLDPGIGGGLTGSGDVHFRVTYRLLPSLGNGNPQDLILSFGTLDANGHTAVGPGGVQLPFQNANYALFVIPEPGTALLMGLGLAALATRRR